MEQQTGREGEGVRHQGQVIARTPYTVVAASCVVLGAGGIRVPERSPHLEDVPHIFVGARRRPRRRQSNGDLRVGETDAVRRTGEHRSATVSLAGPQNTRTEAVSHREGELQAGEPGGHGFRHDPQGHCAIHIAIQATRAQGRTETTRSEIDVEVRAARSLPLAHGSSSTDPGSRVISDGHLCNLSIRGRLSAARVTVLDRLRPRYASSGRRHRPVRYCCWWCDARCGNGSSIFPA